MAGAQGAKRRLGDIIDITNRRVRERLQALNRDPRAIRLASDYGLDAGVPAGLARGAFHAVKGAWDTLDFAQRLRDPLYDRARSRNGRSALDEVRDTSSAIAGYGRRVAEDSSVVGDDLKRLGRKLRQDLDRTATPMADTALGEFRRTAGIGMNNGELAFNIATLPTGGEAASLAMLRNSSRVRNATRYLDEAGHADAVAYLAKPYEGRGHHSIVRNKATWPESLGGGPLPSAIRDSPFNLVQFKGLSQGEAYAVHNALQKQFYGARVSPRVGVRGWSARLAGVTPFNPVERIWYGTPEATRQVLGGLAGSAYGLIHEPLDEEYGW